MIALIVNLHSFYDQSVYDRKGTVLLNRLKNSIHHYQADIKRSRKAQGIDESDTGRLIKKIEKTFKRIATGAGKDSFARIKAWRHGEYAHIALIPGRAQARPELRDITRCFVLTAKVLRDVYSLLSPDSKDELMLLIRGVLKRQAQQFVDSIRPLPPVPPPPRRRGFGFAFTSGGVITFPPA